MAKAKQVEQTLTITPPNLKVAEFRIRGNAPYMQNKFSSKAKDIIERKQELGSVATKNKKKEPRDFEADYRGAMHVSREGWIGIPAPALRVALISACRMANFTMTKAKLSLMVLQDSVDADDNTPLIRIYGEPERSDMMVRNATGVCDIRVRPVWPEWSAVVRIQYDADQFQLVEVANLLARAGMQVGIGEGRPDSKSSAGIGYGTFDIVND